jgi:polysaccharide biosynthesis protein PslH
MSVPADGGRRLKVLVVDESIPYPPNSGKTSRTWNLLRRLASRHSVCILCYGYPNAPGTAEIEKLGIDLRVVEPRPNLAGWRLYLHLFLNLFSPFPFSVAKHYSRNFQRQLDELLKEDSWDLIQVEWTPYARFITRTPKAPVLMATHNVESQIWARRAEHTANPFAKVFFSMQEWKMHRFEKWALLRASAATAVTNLDLSTLRSWGVTNVNLVSNGVDLERYSPASGGEREEELLFLASLDWYANQDALGYFVKNILSAVRERRPGATLRIVGRKPPESISNQYSSLPGIEFVGEVKEVGSHLDRATVIIVPLRIGGGSRIKILEALAAGKAVISTTIGAEGLDVISREHLLIADSPAAFAGGIEELLGSTQLRRRLGANGRNLVAARYGWDQIAIRLETVWYDVSENQTALGKVPLSPLGWKVTQ